MPQAPQLERTGRKREDTPMAGNETSGTGIASPATSGGAGLSARQVQIRSFVQAAGMLPVLIIICIAFH